MHFLFFVCVFGPPTHSHLPCAYNTNNRYSFVSFIRASVPLFPLLPPFPSVIRTASGTIFRAFGLAAPLRTWPPRLPRPGLQHTLPHYCRRLHKIPHPTEFQSAITPGGRRCRNSHINCNTFLERKALVETVTVPTLPFPAPSLCISCRVGEL